MMVETTPQSYILRANIGPAFQSDSITIASKKSNALMIVADRWDHEDCHFEWQVAFDRDVTMSGIQAKLQDGVLTVVVRRVVSP